MKITVKMIREWEPCYDPTRMVEEWCKLPHEYRRRVFRALYKLSMERETDEADGAL